MGRRRYFSDRVLGQYFDLIAQSPEEAKLVVAERGNGVSRNPEEVVKPSDLVFNARVLGWPARPRLPWSEQLDSVEMAETEQQFLFNSLDASHIAQIHETYNTLTYRKDHFRDTAPPFIVQYAGARKPWSMPRRNSYYLETTQPHNRIASQKEVASLIKNFSSDKISELAVPWLDERMNPSSDTNSFSAAWGQPASTLDSKKTKPLEVFFPASTDVDDYLDALAAVFRQISGHVALANFEAALDSSEAHQTFERLSN